MLSASIVLSFDEYNKVIHFFSDPANPDGIGDNGIVIPVMKILTVPTIVPFDSIFCVLFSF